MSLHLQPTQVATGSEDSGGYLVFSDSFLVAVLVRLSQHHEEGAGMWFLEAGFGYLAGPEQPYFEDLGEAHAWISQRLAKGLARASMVRAPT